MIFLKESKIIHISIPNLKVNYTRQQSRLNLPLYELLNKQDWELNNYLKDFSSIILESALNPRIIGAEIPLIFHSLLVIDKSGVPFYTYSFPGSKLTEEFLTSAGLTVIVTGLAQLISELVRRK